MANLLKQSLEALLQNIKLYNTSLNINKFLSFVDEK